MDSKLAKRIKKLVKKWQSLLQNYTPVSGSIVNSKHVNGMMAPAENGIDTKPTLPISSGSNLSNTNTSGSGTASFVDVNQKSVKLKQQLCSTNLQATVWPHSTTSNSAPHPIGVDCRHKVLHTNTTVVTFVHPPPEPMPSSLIVSISRHSVKLKDHSSYPCINISTGDDMDNSLVTANIPGDTPFDAHFMDMPSSYNNLVSERNLDELLGIKSELSTGKQTPVDEIISSDSYLLDMNMDYNSIMSAMSEVDRVFNNEELAESHDIAKVEGVDGFFSCRGTWCDWTQPIPSRDEESVVVLPYVYID